MLLETESINLTFGGLSRFATSNTEIDCELEPTNRYPDIKPIATPNSSSLLGATTCESAATACFQSV